MLTRRRKEQVQDTANTHQQIRPGLAPGTVQYIGERKGFTPEINVMRYDVSGYTEEQVTGSEVLGNDPVDGKVTWYDLCGVHDTDLLIRLGNELSIHTLALEDIADTSQRAKYEEYPDFIFICLKMIRRVNKRTVYEHISIIAGDGYVVSFQEREGDVFEPIRNRIRNGLGIIRKRDSYYLAYAIVDAIVDHYFIIAEKLEKSIHKLEEMVLSQKDVDIVQRTYSLRTDLVRLKRAIFPTREIVSAIRKNPSPLNTKEMDNYLTDLNEHVVQVLDQFESYRDHINSVIELNLALVSTKMNSVMKVLTAVSTIFIPLTFIAGVYGMNFRYMPELAVWWAYPAVWVVMILIGGTLFTVFKRLKWF